MRKLTGTESCTSNMNVRESHPHFQYHFLEKSCLVKEVKRKLKQIMRTASDVFMDEPGSFIKPVKKKDGCVRRKVAAIYIYGNHDFSISEFWANQGLDVDVDDTEASTAEGSRAFGLKVFEVSESTNRD